MIHSPVIQHIFMLYEGSKIFMNKLYFHFLDQGLLPLCCYIFVFISLQKIGLICYFCLLCKSLSAVRLLPARTLSNGPQFPHVSLPEGKHRYTCCFAKELYRTFIFNGVVIKLNNIID